MTTHNDNTKFQNASAHLVDCADDILSENLSVAEYAARIDLVNDACVMLQELGIHVDLHERTVEQCIVEAQMRGGV